MNTAFLSLLPSLNAGLNLTTAFLLILGFILIKQGAWTGHALCMCLAIITSTLFLGSYLTYHFFHGSTPFAGAGWIRPLYFAILISHTVLAAAVVPLVIVTFVRALRSQFSRHARLARWTFPIWLYVSFTGVLVYWMLYRLAAVPYD